MAMKKPLLRLILNLLFGLSWCYGSTSGQGQIEVEEWEDNQSLKKEGAIALRFDPALLVCQGRVIDYLHEGTVKGFEISFLPKIMLGPNLG